VGHKAHQLHAFTHTHAHTHHIYGLRVHMLYTNTTFYFTHIHIFCAYHSAKGSKAPQNK